MCPLRSLLSLFWLPSIFANQPVLADRFFYLSVFPAPFCALSDWSVREPQCLRCRWTLAVGCLYRSWRAPSFRAPRFFCGYEVWQSQFAPVLLVVLVDNVDICAPDVAHNGIMWLPAHFALSGTCVRYVLSVIPEAGNPEDPKANTNYMIYDIVWYCMILYDIIWYYMILYDIVWYCMILYDIIWYYMILYDILWYYMIVYDIIWYYMILYDIVWYYMFSSDFIILSDIIWYDVIWYEIIRYTIILDMIIWYFFNIVWSDIILYIILYYMIWYDIISCHIISYSIMIWYDIIWLDMI